MKLSRFIKDNPDLILADWDSFAATLEPASTRMTSKALRDHAQQILLAIALDIDTFQTSAEAVDKSQGLADKDSAPTPTAASVHGTLREISGFTLLQLTAEFRALRASVLRMWLSNITEFNKSVTADILRFNEAIDQALAESVVTFSEHANRTRDRFLAILGHDLRAPLFAISMAGTLLERSATNAERNVVTGQHLRRSAATMATMVNDLLEYSRTQLGGRMPMTPSSANMGDIYQAAIHDASAAYPGCIFEVDSTGDMQGNFDSVRLQQVITNLLTNAAQYRTADTPVRLEVRGRHEDVTIAVNNKGPCIPQDALAQVFSALVQLPLNEEQVSRPSTSMGLGLFIARETTLAHGGTINVVSEKISGTTFTVSIPRDFEALSPATGSEMS